MFATVRMIPPGARHIHYLVGETRTAPRLATGQHTSRMIAANAVHSAVVTSRIE